MATCQLSEDQFLCPICLDVFIDPVTLSCGHNFCRKCVNQHWSNTVTYECPYCKDVFKSKPVPKINMLIAELAAHFKTSQDKNSVCRKQNLVKQEEIPCDMCTEPKLKAQKSCLVCLSSFCDFHLQPHHTLFGLKRHQLTEPRENLAGRMCMEHNKLLELFCNIDQLCLCVHCLYSRHKTHDVVLLEEASKQKKPHLMRLKYQVQEMIKTRKLKIRELQELVEFSNTNAAREVTGGVKVFTALIECAQRGLDNLIQEITWKKTETEKRAQFFIDELEQEISGLIKRGSAVKKVLRYDDHLHLLQNFSHLNTIAPIKKWTNVNICPPTYRGVVARALAQLEQDFMKTTRGIFVDELLRVRRFEEDVSLDSLTAHPQLVVSRDCTEVVHTSERRTRPYSPKRFESLFVLGKQGFYESFYFEAIVKRKTEWTLGVAIQSVNRKEMITTNPQNGFWMIHLINKAYYVSEDTKVRVLTRGKLEKVGVFVDYDKGIVSFYDTKAPALIYSFSGFSFNEKLYPICSPGKCWYNNCVPLAIC